MIILIEGGERRLYSQQGCQNEELSHLPAKLFAKVPIC